MTETRTPAGSRVLVFGDDGSPGADVAWLWINNHAWPGWRAEVVHATLPPLVGAPLHTPPVLTEWEPPQPRVAFTESRLDDVRHLTVEVDPRIALDSCTHADVMVVGARGRGMLKAFGVGSTTDWLLHRPLGPPDPPGPRLRRRLGARGRGGARVRDDAVAAAGGHRGARRGRRAGRAGECVRDGRGIAGNTGGAGDDGVDGRGGDVRDSRRRRARGQRPRRARHPRLDRVAPAPRRVDRECRRP